MSRLDPGRLAACYVALWVAHDVADHVIQTDEQATHKAAGGGFAFWGGAMIGHLAGYGATQAVALTVLRAAGIPLSRRRIAAGLALSIATHGFLDRRWPVVALLKATGSPLFADPIIGTTPVHVRQSATATVLVGATTAQRLPLHGTYLADQALHHLFVAAAAAIVAGGSR